jgi:hypothetical protein
MSFSIKGQGFSKRIADHVQTGNTGSGSALWKADIPVGVYNVTATFDPIVSSPSRVDQYLPSTGEGRVIRAGVV